MNTKLLRKIRDHIKEEPKRWSYNWAIASDESPCGTQACIAGWAMVLSGKMTVKDVIRPRWCHVDAGEVLELTDDEARRLFICWPREFCARGSLNDAQVAIKRINFFLKTKGTDILPEPKRKPLSKQNAKDLA